MRGLAVPLCSADLCNQAHSPVAVVGPSWATTGETPGSSEVNFHICKIRIVPMSLHFCEYFGDNSCRAFAPDFDPFYQYYQVLIVN